MNKSKLAAFSTDNPVVRAILDLLSARTTNSKKSSIKRIQLLLKEEGVSVRWPDLVAAFRLLEEAGCGTYIRGSKGHASRFCWTVPITCLGEFLCDSLKAQDDEEDEDAEDVDDDTEPHTVRHAFVLRPDLRISMYLPPGLNQTEADRLAQFAESLSFTAPYEEDEDGNYDDEDIIHSYVLRPDQRVTLRLPADLTPVEATRLAQFVRVLPCTA